ncbi:hypothetical protein Rin_00011350 [Candidatus Regiella insecticola 5.15]|uniref:Uncharacterized protein n=1 Tax=Candidatus Regiella insecticola 5.15 TaxID=1005043 RepID=G2GZC0_9ENTR|nr:hypothetical protein [Candidatus Regiella insecticola]EGY28896.1 hypothetical protein Rin_00011350 [Candidatus Regiella insecticola 5.15]
MLTDNVGAISSKVDSCSSIGPDFQRKGGIAEALTYAANKDAMKLELEKQRGVNLETEQKIWGLKLRLEELKKEGDTSNSKELWEELRAEIDKVKKEMDGKNLGEQMTNLSNDIAKKIAEGLDSLRVSGVNEFHRLQGKLASELEKIRTHGIRL